MDGGAMWGQRRNMMQLKAPKHRRDRAWMSNAVRRVCKVGLWDIAGKKSMRDVYGSMYVTRLWLWLACLLILTCLDEYIYIREYVRVQIGRSEFFVYSTAGSYATRHPRSPWIKGFLDTRCCGRFG